MKNIIVSGKVHYLISIKAVVKCQFVCYCGLKLSSTIFPSEVIILITFLMLIQPSRNSMFHWEGVIRHQS